MFLEIDFNIGLEASSTLKMGACFDSQMVPYCALAKREQLGVSHLGLQKLDYPWACLQRRKDLSS